MSNRLYVATRKGLFTIDRAGGGWKINRCTFFGNNVSMMLPDARDDALYAALDHGHFGAKVHRSTNGGESWQEVAAPAYPQPPEGAEPQKDSFGKVLPWDLKLIWSLETGGPDRPNELWCGTLPGGLFHSTDRGDSWTLVRSLWDNPARKEWFGGGADFPGIHSICVHPRNSKHITLGVSCGGVWVTPDAGQSWKCSADGMRAEYMPPEQQGNPNIQDPHRVVQCRAKPDFLWAQHHNGIFRSTDGSKTWTEIKDVKPSTFGFAVVVHPQDGDTAWFVPGVKDEVRVPVDGKVVVTRTRDGGKSFDILRNGLPQEHAYDIVFRHCLDIDDSGDRLAFGSTTGSLWVSENQGDSWQCVSTHLPPIYCVRFERTT